VVSVSLLTWEVGEVIMRRELSNCVFIVELFVHFVVMVILS
jgi:hypothetical protein